MEHRLITEEKTVRESPLVAYADEPDDSVSEFDDTPKQAVHITCACGKLDGWAEVGEDLTERFERHVKLAGMVL